MVSSSTGGTSRIIVSQSLNRIITNFSGGGSAIGTFNFELNTEYELILYRNASNQVFYSVNGSSDVLQTTNSANFVISDIGKGTTTRRLTGYFKEFQIDADLWGLNEGSGINVSSANGLTGVYNSTGDLTHINNVSWEQI